MSDECGVRRMANGRAVGFVSARELLLVLLGRLSSSGNISTDAVLFLFASAIVIP